ncbi:hypothetical protein BC832DRAFT_476183 [Gaertneriomyces semiglobifer]|nr:hypothetical protein BC832DRAFT_476183 [Gaertneriomyces semiglobifer]
MEQKRIDNNATHVDLSLDVDGATQPAAASSPKENDDQHISEQRHVTEAHHHSKTVRRRRRAKWYNFPLHAVAFFAFTAISMSYTAHDSRIPIVWLPTGALAGCLIMGHYRLPYIGACSWLPYCFIHVVIVFAAMCIWDKPGNSAATAVISTASGLCIAGVVRYCYEMELRCDEDNNFNVADRATVLESLKPMLGFLVITPAMAAVESAVRASVVPYRVRLEWDGEGDVYQDLTYSRRVLRVFAPYLYGTLFITPLVLRWERMLTSKRISCSRWVDAAIARPIAALLLVLALALSVAIPFGISAAPDAEFSAAFFYMWPLIVCAAFGAGMIGVSIISAISLVVVIEANRFNEDEGWVMRAGREGVLLPDMLEKLQFWCAVSSCAGLILTALLSERIRLKKRFVQMQSDINAEVGEKGNKDGLPPPITTMDSAMILNFVCSEFRKPLRDITDLCTQTSTTSAAHNTSSLDASGNATAMADPSTDTIKHLSQQVLSLLEDAYDVAKLSHGAVPSDAGVVELSRFLESVVREMEVEVDLRLEEGVPKHVALDPYGFRKVIQAIIKTGLKFKSPTSTLLFTTSSTPTSLYFSVLVSALLSDIDIQTLLRPYLYPQNLTTTTADLSMVIASGYARAMGGDLKLYTQSEGTVFCFLLPIRSVRVEKGSWGEGIIISLGNSQENLASTLNSVQETGSGIGVNALPLTTSEEVPSEFEREMTRVSLQGQKQQQQEVDPLPENPKMVVVADDSSISRAILVRILRKHTDLRVIEAVDGAQALQLCLMEKTSILFIDLEMPVMDGLQAATRLRHSDFTSPIILTTAHSEASLKRDMTAVSSVLYKPITVSKVLSILSHYNIIPPEPSHAHLLLPSPPTAVPASPALSLKHMKMKTSDSLSSSNSSLHTLSTRAPILLVDDDITARDNLRVILRTLVPGREVVEAVDGNEAVELCAKRGFAIVMMALEVKGLDGETASSRIRNTRSPSSSSPIIAMTTAPINARMIRTIRAAGMNDVVIKPLSIDAVKECFRKYHVMSAFGPQ